MFGMKWSTIGAWSINSALTGAVFVDELWEVPDESIVIFSAHGVSREVQQEALDRNLTGV